MIDWSKPIELDTVPPRPAVVLQTDDHHTIMPALVKTDWHLNGRPVAHWVYADGSSCLAVDRGITARVRNVTTPTDDVTAELLAALKEIDRRYTAWLAASPARATPGVKPGTIRNMGDIARAAIAKAEARK